MNRHALALEYRAAEYGMETPWLPYRGDLTFEGVHDELLSWGGPSLRHGDLVRVTRGLGNHSLYVWDGSSGALMKAPNMVGQPVVMPWLQVWENDLSAAKDMLLTCEKVNPQRLGIYVMDCLLDVAVSSEPYPNAGLCGVLNRAREAIRTGESVWSVPWVAQTGQPRYVQGAAVTFLSWYSKWQGKTFPGEKLCQVAITAEIHARQQLPRTMLPTWVGREAKRVRKFIPTTVAVCASLGLRDPLPLPPRNTMSEADR